MAGFGGINRCFELGDAQVAEAVETRGGTKELLERMATIAKPNQGAPKILLVFARMATSACDWLDGELRIEIVGDKEVTVIEVMTDLGGGMRERILPALMVNVPVVEFVRAVERVPKMIEPLVVRTKDARRLILAAARGTRRSLPPPPVKIADDSLMDRDAGKK